MYEYTQYRMLIVWVVKQLKVFSLKLLAWLGIRWMQILREKQFIEGRLLPTHTQSVELFPAQLFVRLLFPLYQLSDGADFSEMARLCHTHSKIESASISLRGFKLGIRVFRLGLFTLCSFRCSYVRTLLLSLLGCVCRSSTHLSKFQSWSLFNDRQVAKDWWAKRAQIYKNVVWLLVLVTP